MRSDPISMLNHGMPDVDVAAVAQTFGGGGHRNAAGARVTGKLAEVRTSIASHLQAELSGFGEPPA
jgi:phosphoesterase RecJ-like protein